MTQPTDDFNLCDHQLELFKLRWQDPSLWNEHRMFAAHNIHSWVSYTAYPADVMLKIRDHIINKIQSAMYSHGLCKQKGGKNEFYGFNAGCQFAIKVVKEIFEENHE